MTSPLAHADSLPSQLPRDIYPVVRIATAYCLRGFELLDRLQGDPIQGLIFLTLVRDQLSDPASRPISGRALSRTLSMPYETVRRHAVKLVQSGQCLEKQGGLVVPPAVCRGRPVETFLRGLYLETARALTDLTRIEAARYRVKLPRAGPLTKDQRVIALAATTFLLAGIKTLRGYWAGDMVKGLVFTTIWTTNVRHVMSTAAAGTRDVLGDEHRQPVTVLALSKTLGLPYETARRHVQALMRDGLCVRQGNHGLVVPATAHRQEVTGAVAAYGLMIDLLAELRREGVKV